MSRNKLFRSGRQRGISLLEGVLYLTLVGSVIVFSAEFIRSEQQRQEQIALGGEAGFLLERAQAFVADNHENLVQDLVAEASNPLNPGSEAILSLGLADLSDAGYIDAAFLSGGAAATRFGQEWRLLLRGVDTADIARPRATLTEAMIVPDLLDGDPSNGEMVIEAILVSSGGDAIPDITGTGAAARAGSLGVGFIRSSEIGVSRGAYGVFALDISGFAGLSDSPDPGRFASIVTLADFRTLLDGTAGEGGPPDALRRCADILASGIPETDQRYIDCIEDGNRVYSDILFVNSDTTGSGFPDFFPRIAGVSRIEMDDAGGVPGIGGLRRIDCGPGETGLVAVGTLLVNCDTTEITGDLDVGGDLEVEGDTRSAGTMLSETRVAAPEFSLQDASGSPSDVILRRQTVAGTPETQLVIDRVLLENGMGGLDISTAPFDMTVIPPGSDASNPAVEIPKPFCPATTADGAFVMEPRIITVPVAYSDEDGRAIVGVRTLERETASGDAWTVRMFLFVDEDICETPVNLATWDGNQSSLSCGPGNADGDADVHEVAPDQGRVLVMTRCF